MRRALKPLLVSCASVIAAAALAFSVETEAQQSNARRVPSAIKTTLLASFTQDGRAVDVKISNPSHDWVIESAVIAIEFVVKEDEGHCHKPNRPPPTDRPATLWDYPFCTRFPTELTKVFRGEIQPKDSGSLYVEIKEGQVVESVALKEVRGRQASFTERARAKLR